MPRWPALKAPTTGTAGAARTQERRAHGTGKGVARVGIAAVTGLAWAAAAPPRGWWFLLPVGVAALAVALRGQGLRMRLSLGGLAGLVFYGLSLRWLTGFSVLGYFAATVLETALLAAALGLIPTARAGHGSGGWWTLPAALVLLEAVQTRFPFGGFPLSALAYSQLNGPFVLAAPLGGSLVVTALSAITGVGLAALVLVRGGWRRVVVVVGTAAALVGVPIAVGAALRTTPVGVLDAAVVQGGGPRGLRAVFTDPAATTARTLAAAAQITGSPDLVVLPENVVDVTGTIAGTAVDAQIAALARKLHASVVVGVVETEGGGFRNAAVLWGPDGQRIGRYEKEHRVPFGEYIPGRALLERVTDLTALVPRDAIVGRGPALLASPGAPLGVVISYEVFFADRVRSAVDAGGQVILVPTNASSYTTGEVPAIEVAAARMRAREFGRAVLQAAPTGYSAIIQPDGTVTTQSGLGEAALLHHSVPLRTGLTPYARAGDLPVIVLAIIVLAAPVLIRGERRRRERRAAHPPETLP